MAAARQRERTNTADSTPGPVTTICLMTTEDFAVAAWGMASDNSYNPGFMTGSSIVQGCGAEASEAWVMTVCFAAPIPISNAAPAAFADTSIWMASFKVAD